MLCAFTLRTLTPDGQGVSKFYYASPCYKQWFKHLDGKIDPKVEEDNIHLIRLDLENGRVVSREEYLLTYFFERSNTIVRYQRKQ